MEDKNICYNSCFEKKPNRDSNRSKRPRNNSRNNSSTPRQKVPPMDNNYLSKSKKFLTKKNGWKPLYSRSAAECGSQGQGGAPQGYTDSSIMKMLNAMKLTKNSKGLIHWIGMGDGREVFLTLSMLPGMCVRAIDINEGCTFVANAKLDLLKKTNKKAYNRIYKHVKFLTEDGMKLDNKISPGRIIHTTAIIGVDFYEKLLQYTLNNESVKILSMFSHDMEKIGLNKTYLNEIGADYTDTPMILTGSNRKKTLRIVFFTEPIKQKIKNAEVIERNI